MRVKLKQKNGIVHTYKGEIKEVEKFGAIRHRYFLYAFQYVHKGVAWYEEVEVLRISATDCTEGTE